MESANKDRAGGIIMDPKPRTTMDSERQVLLDKPCHTQPNHGDKSGSRKKPVLMDIWTAWPTFAPV